MSWEDQAERQIKRTEELRRKEADLVRRAQEKAQAEYGNATAMVKGAVAQGRDDFMAKLQNLNLTANKRQSFNDPNGPWVGVEIGDSQGHIATIDFQSLATGTGIYWIWNVQCGGKPKPPKKEPVQSPAQGPSQQYVEQTFGEHFNFCYRIVNR